jgi:hypothetical protein
MKGFMASACEAPRKMRETGTHPSIVGSGVVSCKPGVLIVVAPSAACIFDCALSLTIPRYGAVIQYCAEQYVVCYRYSKNHNRFALYLGISYPCGQGTN